MISSWPIKANRSNLGKNNFGKCRSYLMCLEMFWWYLLRAKTIQGFSVFTFPHSQRFPNSCFSLPAPIWLLCIIEITWLQTSYTLLCYFILCYILLYFTILNSTILCYAIYAMLCYAMLYYTILYYAIQYLIISYHYISHNVLCTCPIWPNSVMILLLH